MTTGGEGGLVVTSDDLFGQKCGLLKIMEKILIQYLIKNITRI